MTSPLASLRFRLLMIMIVCVASIVGAVVGEVSVAVMIAIVIAAAVGILFCGGMLLVFQMPAAAAWFDECATIEAMGNSEKYGIAENSEVFAYRLPAAQAKQGVARMWGMCGIAQQPACHAFLMYEVAFGLLIAICGFFGLSPSSTRAFLDFNVACIAFVFTMGSCLCWRAYTVLKVAITFCRYHFQASQGMNVLVHHGRTGIRAWFCELISPSVGQRMWHWGDEKMLAWDARVVNPANGAVLQFTQKREFDIEWPCCHFPDKALVFEVPVPHDVEVKLHQWLSVHGLGTSSQ